MPKTYWGLPLLNPKFVAAHNPELIALWRELVSTASTGPLGVIIRQGRRSTIVFISRGQIVYRSGLFSFRLKATPHDLLKRLEFLRDYGFIIMETHARYRMITICDF